MEFVFLIGAALVFFAAVMYAIKSSDADYAKKHTKTA